MCGIAGIINYDGYELNTLKHSLFHRGPDDQSIFVENNLALIHTRLAIQDILQGKQPFHYESCSIIFNGEIYNHLALRQKLKHFVFKTASDTETLLYLYIQYGEEMFTLLDGMFAFCIYDRNKNSIILAKDRAGKKPLYYAVEKGSFIFASELNAIKSIAKLEIDEEAIGSYLRAGFIVKPHTPYKSVKEVEPATYVSIKLDDLRIDSKQYFNILETYLETNTQSFADAIVATDAHLMQSVKDRMLTSDVSVGIFLSGGIDSNLIVAMASQINTQIKTFTVKFAGSYDESKLARLTVDKYQTNHTELEISVNLNQDIEHILTRYGEPFMDSSAVPSFYIAKEARKNVGVVLNGDGADELFAGYRRYVPIANKMLHYMKFLSPFTRLFPKPHTKQSSYNYFYRLLSMSRKKGIDLYLSATSDVYEDVTLFSGNSILDTMNEFIKSIFHHQGLTDLSKMLYLDYNLLLFSDLLVKMDIATMANSLEARSPFLSKHMLSFAPSLPDKYKINKFTTKYILRELAKKYLSPELINQPKRGFEVPLKKWITLDLKDKIYDSLRPGCYSEKFIDRKLIETLLQNKKMFPDEKRAKMLWSLFCLEVWYKNEINYIAGKI